MRKFLLLLCLVAPVAFAAEKPPEIASPIHAQAPVGEYSFRKLLLHVYDISFWSDQKGLQRKPYALIITYDMNFSSDELVERTKSEMKKTTDLPDEKIDTYGTKLNAIWPEIHSGDRLTALAISATQTAFFHNGKKIGQVNDPQFNQAFFGIWLSPKTSEPEMRDKLLGH